MKRLVLFAKRDWPIALRLALRIGIHTSTAGALSRSAEKAIELGAQTFQIFSASPRMWRAKTPDVEEVRILRGLREKHDLRPLVVHDSYLINLAAPPSEVRDKSVNAFRGEIERALLIGADYLVTHPGNYKGLTVEQGIINVAEAMMLAWNGVAPEFQNATTLTILLENTAGAGAQLGGQLAELARIRELAATHLPFAVGFCLDTCHCHASGFDLAAESGFDRLMNEAKDLLGLENIPVIHTNDSKAPCNSHVDRHAHIGAGYIGEKGFRRILNHPDLHDKAFILETPVDNPGDDLRNVEALKELVSPRQFPPKIRSIRKRSKRSGMSAGSTTHPST